MFLKNLPVDYLKIDGQFVHNVTHDRIDRSMVEAIAQIGDTMGIRTDRRARRLRRGAGAAGRDRHPVRAGPLHRAPQPVEVLRRTAAGGSPPDLRLHRVACRPDESASPACGRVAPAGERPSAILATCTRI